MSFNRLYNSFRSKAPEGLDDMRAVVEVVIKDREQYQRLLEAQGDEAQQCLDSLQVLAESPVLETKLRSSVLRMMLRLSKRSSLCPNCLTIKNVKKIGDHPIGGGGFGDVWKGKIDNQVVCLKVVKIYQASDIQKLLKEYKREAILWQQLSHPNLLPFMGIYYLDKAQEQLCLVSPWMDRGNLVRYLKSTPRERVDHQSLVFDVASGLAHLHSMKIVHGDLKGLNVLMTAEERACIGDFGLSRVAETHSLHFSTATTGQVKGTTRWLAPELLRSEPPSMSSDMYAYACVCYEIFTGGNMPFHELAEAAVIVAVLLERKYPSRPSHTHELTDEMWAIMTTCWGHDLRGRPPANVVCTQVGALHSRKTRIPAQFYPASDWDSHRLARVRRNVKHAPVDTGAIARFLQKGAPADSQSHVVMEGPAEGWVPIQLSQLVKRGDQMFYQGPAEEWVPIHPSQLVKMGDQIYCRDLQQIQSPQMGHEPIQNAQGPDPPRFVGQVPAFESYDSDSDDGYPTHPNTPPPPMRFPDSFIRPNPLPTPPQWVGTNAYYQTPPQPYYQPPAQPSYQRPPSPVGPQCNHQ